MGQKLYGVDINLQKNALLNATLQALSSAPGSPVTGQIYFDTTLLAWRIYDGTAWTNKATDALLLQGQNGAYYLARTNHSGTQVAATISDLATVVQAYRLDQFAAPTSAVNLNNQFLTNVPDPTLATHVANKRYVDATIQGLSAKPSAMVATVAALPANTYNNGTAGVGSTLTATANGVLTIDGYAPALSDNVLIKNEATTANNGLYVVSTLGTVSVPYVLTRHIDMDQPTEFGGAFIPVENKGTTTSNTLWLCNVANSITVGTTTVSFTQLNAATTYAQGNGILISGGVVSAVANTGVTVNSSGIGADFSLVAKKYVPTAIGDGTTTTFVVTHSLGYLGVVVKVFAVATPFSEIEPEVQHTSINTTTLLFNTAPTTGQYNVVVIG